MNIEATMNPVCHQCDHCLRTASYSVCKMVASRHPVSGKPKYSMCNHVNGGGDCSNFKEGEPSISQGYVFTNVVFPVLVISTILGLIYFLA
jgi:hypothetical protein